MKKILRYFLLCSLFLVSGACLSESLTDSVVQPSQVVARRLDADGNTVRELPSYFTYLENGKVSRYDIPGYIQYTDFIYHGDFMWCEYTRHRYDEIEYINYRYNDDGQMISYHHEWSMGGDYPVYLTFEYDERGRLVRKNDIDGNVTWEYWLYDYEDDGRTRTETHYAYWYLSQPPFLRDVTVTTYDEEYRTVGELVTKYNDEGEAVKRQRISYAYHPGGGLEMKTTETLTDDGWANSGFTRLQYDEQSRLAEWTSGTWSEDRGGWESDRKAVYEYDDAEMKGVVTFYKKQGDEWIYDEFDMHPLFTDPNQKLQQSNMRFFYFDASAFGEGHINQFEISYCYTEPPVYLTEPEHKEAEGKVYPNPGAGSIRVASGVENAVVRFYDLQGRLVMARPFDFNTTVNTEGWAPGLYLWEIWDKTQKTACGKWIKK